MYEKLARWAHRNNMQFKVQNDGGYRVYVWVADAVDGYLGAECVCIHIQPDDEYYLEPAWLGYRFRLRKNERFIEKFIREGVFEDTNEVWLGHTDPEPLFILPYHYRYEHGTLDGKSGVLYWLDKEPSDAAKQEITIAGGVLLWSSPQYAPEMRRRVLFVPNGVPFAHYELYGENAGRETIGKAA